MFFPFQPFGANPFSLGPSSSGSPSSGAFSFGAFPTGESKGESDDSTMPTPLSLFEAWTGAMMAPWMLMGHGLPWLSGGGEKGMMGSLPFSAPLSLSFAPMGLFASMGPALEQAMGAASQTAEAMARAMVESKGGPVQVEVTDTDGPFSIRVAVSIGPRDDADPDGPVIDHDGDPKAALSKR